MNSNFLIKVIKKYQINELREILFDICQHVHAHCNDNCPVFKINNGVPNHTGKAWDCDCARNGKTMYTFIRTHSIVKKK